MNETTVIVKEENTSLPAVLKPVQRKSAEVGIAGFLKDAFLPLVIAVATGGAGYFIGRSVLSKFDSWSPGTQKTLLRITKGHKDLIPVAFTERGAGIGIIYGAYQKWRKKEGKALSVRDIHQDVYTVLDTEELKSQMEQNERIHNGIKNIIAQREGKSSYATQPHRSYEEAVLTRENSPVQI